MDINKGTPVLTTMAAIVNNDDIVLTQTDI
jgi:hypothetical protein